MKLRIHHHQSNKRLALTKINQSVRNIFSNCHQPPTRRNTYFTQNRAYSCPTVWTLISNPPSGESDVKPQTTNTSKPYDFQLEPSCPSLKPVIPESYLRDKTSSPSSVITRDRDRSDQKNAPGLIPNLTHFINDHFPPPTDRNRNHLSPPVKEVPQPFLKRNLEPDQIAIFKTLTTAQKNRIRAKPNQPLEFLDVCKEIKESDIIQLQKDLKGGDMKMRNRAQYLLIDLHSDEVKKNILDSINDALKEDSDDVVPTTDSDSKLHAFDPFSTSTVPNSPPYESPRKSAKGGKGGKGTTSQSRLHLDSDNLTKILTPENQRPLKAIGRVAHFIAANFLFDPNPDDRFIDGHDKTNSYIRAATLTMEREPGRTQIMGTILKFLDEHCDLQCEPPLRSAVPSKQNIRPPWIIEFNLMECDRQKLTNAITILQKYGNKITCIFTDENQQPISVDLRFNLNVLRSFENIAQVSYICRWPSYSVRPILSNNNPKNQPLYSPHALLQISTEHFQLLVRDISKRQDKRCSPPLLQSDDGEFLLTDNFHITRGKTPVMSAKSEMLIDVQNNSLILTVSLETLTRFGATLNTALPPYAFVYFKCPDGSYETIRCDINLANTDDLGPGLCTRTRSTHYDKNQYAPSVLEFIPKDSCFTCNAKSFNCNLCGEDFSNSDKIKFHKNKEPFPSNPNLTKTLTNHNSYLRMITIATKPFSSLTTKGYQSFPLHQFKLQIKRQPVSKPTLRNSKDMISSGRHKKWQERKQFKRNGFARTSRTRSTIRQKVLSQTNMTTATTRRGQHHKALLSLCRIRKWPCLIRPALPNLIQLEKNLLSKNRFESDHFCSNYGFIDLTNIGPRLIYIYSCDLHSAPPKHGILILNG